MSAVIFDLDDTLYRRRRWLLSGFAAVSRHLEVARRLDRREVFRLLVRALRAGHAPQAFQRLCVRFDLSSDLIPGLVQLVRRHAPRLRLSRSTERVLTQLRCRRRLGVLTNGLPTVQVKKTTALGLSRFVDSVVYATDYGGGKPDPLPFLEVATRIGVEPARCVFVGDDPWCDVHGARGVGMRTVRIRRATMAEASRAVDEADVVIDDLGELVQVVPRLLASHSGGAVRCR